VTRPAICLERLQTNAEGKVVYELKHPFRDGTTHILFAPQDFVARLAALVPRPRANLTRYHGVFAPNSPFRKAIVPSSPKPTRRKPKRSNERKVPDIQALPTPIRYSQTWMNVPVKSTILAHTDVPFDWYAVTREADESKRHYSFGNRQEKETEMPRLVIDQDKCLNSGQCAYQPEPFELDDNGALNVRVETPDGALITKAEDAIAMCPGQAISLIDGND
jgi:ferredoxin